MTTFIGESQKIDTFVLYFKNCLIMKTKVLLLALFIISIAMKSDKSAYTLFNSKGKTVKYEKLIKTAAEADIVFFGESHNNPVCHWLELQITKDLFELRKDKLVVGAEMFEADNQLVLSEYVNGRIKSKSFESQARLWPNYKTDYKPLVKFARDNNLDFVATNIPRRYASIVYKSGFEGLDSLSKEAKNFFPPSPIKYDPGLDCYKEMMSMSGMGGMGRGKPNPNFPKAQAIKDATMAFFILKNWSQGQLFLHYNGSYHSDMYQGIVWYLKKEMPELKIITISSVQQKDIEKLEEEYLDQANFIICIPDDMTTTY